MDSTTTSLGWFVLETAQGHSKTNLMTESKAKEVSEQLSERINSKVEEIRTMQRRAVEESNAITVF
ncbi:MAG TPA: hypothetical protein VJ654_00805 [Noviherbaspirillum sp.]|nr:hypothetical protein [Noviherbaspirillum sp.]